MIQGGSEMELIKDSQPHRARCACNVEDFQEFGNGAGEGEDTEIVW